MVDRSFNEAAMRRKIEQARKEREATEQAEELRKQREAAKRKPHCSGFSDVLGKRIIARAERHERILAKIRSGKTTSKPTARKQWDRAIEAAALVCGGDRGKAVMLADKENPGLREKMLAEINRR